MYYTAIEKLSKVFDENHRNFPVDTSGKEAFLEWKKEARKKLNDILKMDKFRSCPLNPKLLESVRVEDGLTREKILIEVEEGIFMPAYVLIPDEAKNRKGAKLLIAMSGHSGGGMMSIAGIRDNSLVNEAIEKFNYDYGYKMAKKGFIVFCPETRGFGERREAAFQDDESILLCTCYHLSRMAYGLGMTLMGMQIFDVLRLVDYIVESEEYDSDNINILGFSGGGLQALYAAALDDRIKNIIISGYMYGYKEAHFERNGNCNCNYVDGLWQTFDMGDIGALIAPRKFIIQSGIKDHLNGKSGLSNVYSQVDIVKSAYKVLECEDLVRHYTYDGPHRWYDDDIDEYISFISDKED